MIDKLPDGKSIGWMQAPVQWIFTHTVRFLGIVRVVILDGEGFILIRKGLPLMYYFKHGRIELRGHGALDYFNSHKTIEFNLCKYTPEEFSRALEICEVAGIPQETVGVTENGRSVPARAEGAVKRIDELPVVQKVEQLPQVLADKSETKSEKHSDELPVIPQVEQHQQVLPKKSETKSEKHGVELPVIRHIEQHQRVLPEKSEQEGKNAIADDSPIPEADVTASHPVPQPGILNEVEIKTIGQIKKLNGIIAISFFNDDRNILLMGDVEIDPLLNIARTMLTTINTIKPHLDWGFFVHMTLQIPEGNLIIAPYHENHLCILTTRTINIGHIRRILRDLQQDSDREMMR